MSKSTQLETFGDLIPYCDPSWFQGHHTAYFNENHAAFRAEVNKWVSEVIEPNIEEWEEEEVIPSHVYKQMGTRGYLAGMLDGPYPTQYTNCKVESVSPQNWNALYEYILIDEISRVGASGVMGSLISGYQISVPLIYRFGPEALKKRILPNILNGDKRSCLCITEPDAGSDVANINASAVKTDDGKFYIVNGEKKWITNGVFSDYFLVAVRTGPPNSGMNGISMLLLEKDSMPGITTRKMSVMGGFMSGTTYVTFEDVKVPVENLIGIENQGFKSVMSNFNHERLGIAISGIRNSRVCLEE